MVRLLNAPPVSTATIAKRFMADLRSGRRPSIEAALDAGPRAEWGLLLKSLLIAEVNSRRARGESPLPREYLPRFPAHPEVVQGAFPELLGNSIAATLPVPLTGKVTGPVPKAIVLTQSSRSLRHWRRQWLLLLATVSILAVVCVIWSRAHTGEHAGIASRQA